MTTMIVNNIYIIRIFIRILLKKEEFLFKTNCYVHEFAGVMCHLIIGSVDVLGVCYNLFCIPLGCGVF